MSVSRRLFLSTAALGVAAVAHEARADVSHYPMHCDPELRPALETAAVVFLARSDIRVHIWPTSDGLMVPQIAHVSQSDIVMTRPDVILQLAAIGHDVPDAPHLHFRGALVLAALAGTPEVEARTGPIAARDKLDNVSFDSAVVLAAMGLSGVRFEGTVDTADAAFQVVSGASKAALVYLSDVRADPRLRVVAEAPAQSYPPVVYVATTTQAPRRANPEAFVNFLASVEGRAIMASFGLELMA